ncbi:MAG: hypothetical protein HQL08_05330 [Nitrospirae bacterium]|nr:hypothetical protein [Nitrospirota bacterium]
MKEHTINRRCLFSGRLVFLALLLLCQALFSVSPSLAAEVLIIGDIQYKPVADVVGEIRAKVKLPLNVYSTSDARGKLKAIVEREDARTVVALGKDAVDEALLLPPSVAVIYGLVIAPVKTSRSNITGVYMATPINEYVGTIRKYMPSIRRISIVGSRYLMSILDGRAYAQVAAYNVSSSSELVNTVNGLDESNALILLPDVAFLTSAVMENVYLFSFRKNIPLLGISEGNVKQGSLFALVFDSLKIGRQIGELVMGARNGVDMEEMPPAPPAEFDLFINTNTARKMGIVITDEMIRKAKKIYQ